MSAAPLLFFDALFYTARVKPSLFDDSSHKNTTAVYKKHDSCRFFRRQLSFGRSRLSRSSVYPKVICRRRSVRQIASTARQQSSSSRSSRTAVSTHTTAEARTEAVAQHTPAVGYRVNRWQNRPVRIKRRMQHQAIPHATHEPPQPPNPVVPQCLSPYNALYL